MKLTNLLRKHRFNRCSSHEKTSQSKILLRPTIYCLMVIILMITSSLNAQQVKLLSLNEAIELAMLHDVQTKADSTDVEIALSRLEQTKNMALPEINLNGNYTRISNNITPLKVDFPSGAFALNPQILNQSFNSLQLKQLLFVGGRLKYGTEIFKRETDLARFEIEKNRLNTSYNVAILWYNLYVLSTSKKTIEVNIKTLLLNQQDVKNYVAQGLSLEIDALKIDLAITSLESNLVDISNSIIGLNYNLSIATGSSLNTIFELPELVNQSYSNISSKEEFIQSALANRVELKKLESLQTIANLDLKLSKANLLPTVSSIASANYNMPEQRVFPNKNQFTPTWFLGLNVNWAISNLYKNPSRIKESKLNIQKKSFEFEIAKEQIMQEVNEAYTEYLQAVQKIVINEKAVTQATENFRVEQNRLKAAIITPVDYLDANAKLLQANLNLSAANANAQLAFIKLNKTTNK